MVVITVESDVLAGHAMRQESFVRTGLGVHLHRDALVGVMKDTHDDAGPNVDVDVDVDQQRGAGPPGSWTVMRRSRLRRSRR